jgi:hypothetical protein
MAATSYKSTFSERYLASSVGSVSAHVYVKVPRPSVSCLRTLPAPEGGREDVPVEVVC